MASSRGAALACLTAIALVMENVAAFVTISPKATSSSLRHGDLLCHHVATNGIMLTSYQKRQQRSFGALRMAEGDDAKAAVEEADELKERAAALRDEAASVERSMGRDPSSTATVEGSPAPPLRPTDLPRNDGEPPKREISDAMKDRLRRELESQGANPNKSAGNPILLVAAIVGLLVIIGGRVARNMQDETRLITGHAASRGWYIIVHGE